MCEWYFQLVGKTIQTKNHRSLKPRTSVHSLPILSFMVPFHVLFIFIYISIYIYISDRILCHTPTSAGCTAIYCRFHREKRQNGAALPDVCTIRMPHSSGYAPKIWSSHPALLSLRLNVYIYILLCIIMYTMYDD
jgi:hypothetical protein